MKTTKLIEKRNEFMLIADEHFIEAVKSILQDNKMSFEEYPTVNFYMSREQEKLLMNSESLELPEGYELGSATPEDAKVITDCWRHKGPGEEQQTKLTKAVSCYENFRMKVAVFPSSCIRYQGEPIAFEMIHGGGFLNHLFVMPEHRRKGLGAIVEQDLARKLIREDFHVFKTVELYNESVLASSFRSPYWSYRKKEDDSPLLRVFLAVQPAEVRPVQ